MIDGTLRAIIREAYVEVYVTPYTKHGITFDVFDLASYDVVLGLLWLRDYNPDINWKNQLILLKKVKDALSFSIPAMEYEDLLDKKTKKASTPRVEKMQGLVLDLNTTQDQNVSEDKE
jgi:hypothetical protein